jgi:acyl-CoA thioesterase
MSSQTMMRRDRASAALGIEVVTDEAGYAVVRMPVRDYMLNGFDIIHGGLVFALADTAFAIACNEDDDVTVGASADITFLKSATTGTVLTATARRVARRGRTGLYDVSIVDDSGDAIAEFRGRSVTTRRPAPPAS